VVLVLPLLSVTVTDIVNVPALEIAAVWKLAPSYVMPSKVVLTDDIVLPYMPAAVIFTFNFDSDDTYTPLPKAACTAVTASATVTLDMGGTTVDGTVTVRFTDFVPIVVLPDFVVTVTVAVADVPAIAFIQVTGMVNAVPDVTVLL
jgi:hypothetical protein